VTPTTTHSDEQTRTLAEQFGRGLTPGSLVALCGAMGAGKTVFAQGIARGLGVAREEPVVSPTFVLVRQYACRVPLFHCDAYRIASSGELAALGLDEMRQQGVLLIEWADRFDDWLAAADYVVHLDHEGPTQRSIRIDGPR
jgi:tRNA threonylcarbamoyladenosine biosynthesis protein TsaE